MRVAVVGFGTAGICTARACLEEGLDLTVYEQRIQEGGMWSGENAPMFDNLTMNSSVYESYIAGVSSPQQMGLLGASGHLCLKAEEMGKHLRAAANFPALRSCVQFGVRVTRITRVRKDTSLFRVSSTSDTMPSPSQSTKAMREVKGKAQEKTIAKETEEEFDAVVVCTGFFRTPYVPQELSKKLSDFRGRILHASEYRNPKQVSGKRVLIVGGSVSGLEIAADMACGSYEQHGPSNVTISTRHMRQLALKERNGRVFSAEYATRFAAWNLLTCRMTPSDVLRRQQEFFIDHDAIGAPRPTIPLYDQIPGIVIAPARLPEAAAGLRWNIGGLRRVSEGHTVEFEDGTSDEFDVIVLATGYEPDLSFLDDDLRAVIAPTPYPAPLHLFLRTLHPNIPGLAFVGVMYTPGAANAPLFDAQARWVAGLLARAVPPVETRIMRDEISRTLRIAQREALPGDDRLNLDLMDEFARLGQFAVDFGQVPHLAEALIFGPLCPPQYRICGRHRETKAVRDFEQAVKEVSLGKNPDILSMDQVKEVEAIVEQLKLRNRAPEGIDQAIQNLNSKVVQHHSSNG